MDWEYAALTVIETVSESIQSMIRLSYRKTAAAISPRCPLGLEKPNK